MGEHLPCKQGVKGSNPFISTEQATVQYLFLENRIPNNIKIFCDESKDSKEDRDIRGYGFNVNVEFVLNKPVSSEVQQS